MVKFPLPPDTFPKLALAPKDVAALEAVAAQLVGNTLAQYHEHEVERRGIVDELRWKRVRQKDDIRVFKERTLKPADRSAAAQRRSADAAATKRSRESDKVAPVLMGVGTICGDLDDVMFGVLNPTSESMRIKSSYSDDGFLDGAVLATLVPPSHDDPLRSLTIRWCVKRNPILMTGVVRMRDVVYLESTGIAATKSGERIGYQLLHSVELPEVRALMEYQLVRANVSFCYIYRQKTADTVDVFMRGMLNPLGDVHPSLCAISTAEALVSVSTNIHCAQMKKLLWLLRRAKSQPFPAIAVSEPEKQSRSSSHGDKASHCSVCQQSRHSTFSLSGSRKSCATCLEPICGKCCVVKKLSFISPMRRQETDVFQTKFTFCTRCAMRAFEANALSVATDEIDDPHATYDDDFYRLRAVADSRRRDTHESSASSRSS